MKDREPTPESLALGAALEKVMREAGFNPHQMGIRLGRHHTYVLRLLSGKRGGQTHGVVEWLDACDVTGQRRLEIVEMRLPCGLCGCSCDHTGILACCEATAVEDVLRG